MSRQDSWDPMCEGYLPKKEERGYQPARITPPNVADPQPQTGYVPTSEGDNSTSRPKPPGDE